MPLYECRCERCELTFEVLAPLSSSGMKSRPCPNCGRAARRIISAVAFTVEGGARSNSTPDVTQLKVPPPARLCWMDDRSAARFAAYKHGRGAEYDDKTHERAEARKKRDAPAQEPAAAAHPHAHSHTPLADPLVYANRRDAAARKAKAAGAKEITSRPRRPA
jgi:putative FmdB family regulatory protein